MTDVGIVNAIKMSLAPYIIITISASSLPLIYFVCKLFKFIIQKAYDHANKSTKESEELRRVAENILKNKNEDI